jgi:hypothetical protein
MDLGERIMTMDLHNSDNEPLRPATREFDVKLLRPVTREHDVET